MPVVLAADAPVAVSGYRGIVDGPSDPFGKAEAQACAEFPGQGAGPRDTGAADGLGDRQSLDGLASVLCGLVGDVVFERASGGSDQVRLLQAAGGTFDLNTPGATAWDNSNVDETNPPHTTVPYDQSPPEGAWTQITGTNLVNIQSDNSTCFSNAGSWGD